MNRRDFLRNIALVAIGHAALPQQIEALTNIFDINAPKLSAGLIAIDEIYIGGMAEKSAPTIFEFIKSSNKSPILNLSMNLFGGVVRWVATPEGRIFTREEDFILKARPFKDYNYIEPFQGSIMYTDQNLIRKVARFDSNFQSMNSLSIVALNE